MKANEAPEKIYLIRNIPSPTALNNTNDCREKYLQEWYKGREKDTDVEYTRTDAFIEKAYSWLKNHYRDYMHNPTGERLEAFFGGDMCNDFENYMKEEIGVAEPVSKTFPRVNEFEVGSSYRR